ANNPPIEITGVVRARVEYTGLTTGLPSWITPTGKTGGLVTSSAIVPGFANGGKWGKLRGPGTPTSDSILARLSRDEYITNAGATKFWGDDFMDSLNRKMLPTSFMNMLGAAASSNSGP